MGVYIVVALGCLWQVSVSHIGPLGILQALILVIEDHAAILAFFALRCKTKHYVPTSLQVICNWYGSGTEFLVAEHNRILATLNESGSLRDSQMGQYRINSLYTRPLLCVWLYNIQSEQINELRQQCRPDCFELSALAARKSILVVHAQGFHRSTVKSRKANGFLVVWQQIYSLLETTDHQDHRYE